MGRGALAVECAELLRREGHDLAGVISADAKISAWAAREGIVRWDSVHSGEARALLSSVDYLFSIINGEILDAETLALPRRLAINYHNAALPKYAGVHATSWAILNGDERHGVTWHVMTPRIDAGDVLRQVEFPIGARDSALALNLACHEHAIASFAELVRALAEGRIERQSQDLSKRSYFAGKRRHPSRGLVSWEMSANEIDRIVRAHTLGASPNALGLPLAPLGDDLVVAVGLSPTGTPSTAAPGSVVANGETLRVATGTDDVTLDVVRTLDGETRRGEELGFAIGADLRANDGRLEAWRAFLAESNANEGAWHERARDLPRTPLPIAWPGPTATSPIVLDAGSAAAKRWDAPPSQVALTALLVYLGRYVEQGPIGICVSTPSLRRAASSLAPLASASSPLRIELDPAAPFAVALANVRASLARLEADGPLPRDLPLRYPARDLSFSCPISVEIADDALRVAAIGSSAASLARVRDHVAALVADLERDPRRPIAELDARPIGERAPEVERVDYDALPPWEAIARLPAEAIAISSDGSDDLSYGALRERAERVAAVLGARGVRPGDRVAVLLPRSQELAVALFAVLRVGAAYVPLDPAWPDARRRFIMGDAGARLVVTSASLSSASVGREVVLVDAESNRGADTEMAPPARLDPESVAYVMYTSGSSGDPKGVLCTWGGLRNRLAWSQAAYPISSADVLLQTAAVGFDISIWEILFPLLAGARLVVSQHEARDASGYLVETVIRERVTFAHFVPSLLRSFLDGADGAGELPLRVVVCGGEALGPALRDAFFERSSAELFHAYGPTEASISVTHWRCRDPRWPDRVPLGDAIANTIVDVRDHRLRAIPFGLVGEIVIGGVAVAAGYLGAAKAEDRFTSDPERPGERLYRTGDLGRRLSDGALEFMGRRDRQIKVRGHRIEPAEIEIALEHAPEVRRAAVVCHLDPRGQPSLVAYVEGTAPLRALREWLGARLPRHMIPAQWVLLPSLPLSPNGKVDRRRLPAPSSRARDEDVPFVAPSGRIEEALASAWSRVLGVGEIGRDDDFLALGGDSLHATRVVALVASELDVRLTLKDLFAHTSIAALAARIEAQATVARAAPIARLKAGATTRLSFAQERVWFLEEVHGPGPHNVPFAWRLRGHVDAQALAGAFTRLAERHDVLRRGVRRGEDALESIAVAPPELAVRTVPASSVGAELAAFADRPFALSEAPWRAELWRIEAGESVLALVVHHIAADRWSVQIALRELAIDYEEVRAGRVSSLAEPPFSYADYAAWQRALPRSSWARDLDYWREVLAGAPARIDWPMARPCQARGSCGARLRTELCDVRGLRRVAERAGITLQMLLFAAYTLLLRRLTGSEDIVVGVPVANRERPEVQSLVGLLTNTALLRVRCEHDATFDELLARVREAILDATAHQAVPFNEVVAELRSDGTATPEIFETMFVFDDEAQALRLGDAVGEGLALGTSSSMFALTLVAEDRGATIGLEWEYASSLFERDVIERFAEGFARLVDEIVAKPSRMLRAFTWQLAPAEPAPLAEARPVQSTIVGAFVAQARRTPDAIAVLSGDQKVTYRELDAHGNRVARALRRRGVVRGDIVAVHLERSPAFVAAILGILKAGAAYLPIDPSDPPLRKQDLIARARMVLVDGVASEATSIAMADVAAEDGDPLAEEPSLDDLAYVVFTSGSTGRPKGVLIEHRALANYIDVARRGFALSETDRVVQFASLGFDAAAEEIWSTLSCGAALVLRDDDMLTPSGLFTACARHAVTVLDLPTAFWNRLAADLEPDRAPPSSLRLVVVGGERLLADRVLAWRRWLARHEREIRLLNTYGPTEATIVATWYEITRDPDGEVPIGRPVPGVFARVLDERRRAVPGGAIGELALGGIGLARGYLDAADETSFVNADDGARLYLTGDRVRMRADGELEFVGRADDQVKLRGFRVELAEIETVIASHPAVRGVAVRVDCDRDRVVAFVEASADLEAFLRARLPSYMLPTLVAVEALPRLPSGKIDRSALSTVEVASRPHPPATSREAEVAAIFAETLRLADAGPDTDFFAAGGHSLLAIELVGRIRRRLGVDVAMRALFDHPTVAALAEHIALDGSKALLPIPETDVTRLPLTPSQRGIWVTSKIVPALYNIPLAIEIDGELDTSALAAAMDRVVARHEALRTRFVERDGEIVQEATRTGPRLVIASGASGELHALASEPFDFDAGPPIRLGLLRGAPDRHILVIVAHHVALDGLSLDVLLEELDAELCGVELPPARRALDVLAWDAARRESTRARSRAYWSKALEGMEAAPDRPRAIEARAEEIAWVVPARLAGSLRSLATAQRATLSMTLLAAWQTFLALEAESGDVVLGTPLGGREHPEAARVMGALVDVAPIRLRLEAQATFIDVLREVRAAVLGAIEHRGLALEELRELADLPRASAGRPFLREMFSFEEGRKIRLGGLTVRERVLMPEGAKFDRELAIRTEGEALSCTLRYAADTGEASAMSARFMRLLEAVVAEPTELVRALSLLDDGERAQILAWGDGGPPASGDLLPAVLATPRDRSAVAITSIEGDCSYTELDARSGRLARLLLERGIGAGDRVAVLLDRSTELIVALLAIWRVGAVYVPIAPHEPRARIAMILGDCAPRLVVTDGGVAIDPSIGHLSPSEIASARGEAPPWIQTKPDDVAYVIYTSGSTGKPKGVECTHAGIANRVSWSCAASPATPRDSLLQLASIGFDISLWEILFPLVCGGRLVIPPPGRLSVEALVEAIEREKIRVIHFVPSLLEAFLDHADPARCASLALVVCGGDRVPPSLRERVLSAFDVELHHAYGPTEASISVTHFDARRGGHEGAMPLGRPIAGARLYVLLPGDRLAPPGVGGQLHIAGIPLARGYVNDEALTSLRFVTDPFVPGERMYRTGDRARWLSDGQLEFLGRADAQVKIRGVRVELGEVEAALIEHPSVRSVVVVAPRGADGRAVLVAYVVADEMNRDALLAHMNDRLSETMRPRLVFLAALPMLSSGKVDRAALAERPVPAVRPREERDASSELRTDEERILAAIWRELLAAPRVVPSDDFFLLGGDSIAAIRVVARARARGLLLDVRQIFATPTLEALARLARRAHATAAPTRTPPLTASQRAFFESEHGDRNHFNQAIVLEAKAHVEPRRLEKALRSVVAHHDALRLRFAAGADRATVASVDDAANFAVEAATVANDAEWLAAAERTQRGLDITRGPLVRALVARVGAEQRLLLVVHHLAIDGVSWNVLVEDLSVAYEALVAGRHVSLPAATPFSAYAQSVEGAARSVADVALVLPNVDAHDSVCAWTLGRAETSRLASKARSLRASVEHLLLAAFARAYAEETRAPRVVALREAHGRDGTFVDAARTIGWIATEQLLELELEVELELDADLAVDLDRDKAWSTMAARLVERTRSASPAANEIRRTAELRWNYLGQLTDIETSLFRRIEAPSGDSGIGQSSRRRLDVSAEIASGVLRGELVSHGFDEAAVASLGERWRRGVAQIVATAESEEAFPLAPLQAGLLWHALVAPSSGRYHTQMLFELVGPIDEGALEEAWQEAARRHACLRTRFVWEGVPEPIQVVTDTAQLPWERAALPTADPAEIDAILQRDRARPFRLEEAPLSRLVSIAAGAKRFLLWSHHHILLDGWSLPLVLRAVAEAYEAIRRGETPAWSAPPRYADYVAWIARRDPAVLERFWREKLAGAAPSLLLTRTTHAGGGSQRSRLFHLDGDETAALRRAAERGRTTLHSIVAAAWGLLLRGRLRSDDVSFGVVVSIRPDEIPGVESMVGLLMNTLPMRLRLRGDSDVWDLVRAVQGTLLDLLEHGQAPLSRVLAWAETTNLFDTLIVFESYPGDRAGQRLAAGELLAVRRVVEHTEYPIVLTVLPDEALGFDLTYDAGRIDDEEASALGDRFVGLLRRLTPALAKGSE